MLVHSVVLHAFCDGKNHKCASTFKIIHDTGGEIDDARISAENQLKDQGWSFLSNGIVLCPECEASREKKS